MDLSALGKWIAVVGLTLLVLGGGLWLLGRAGVPLGRLPGDLQLQKDGLSCYLPIATMILVSLVLTVLLNIIARLLSR